MKVDIVSLSREHYEELFKLVKIAEPFKGFQYYDQFCQGLDSRIGFTYWVNNKLIGLISLSDYYPGISVMIHAVFHPKYREAMNRKVIRHIFRYVFNKLTVNRITSYSIKGITDNVVKFLEGVGFVCEGCLRESVELSAVMYDLLIYGLLRKDCRWL